MRSRAALLPTPGDPFLIRYWLENYKKFWKDEVDHLYVHLNTSLEKEGVDYIMEMLNEVGATVIYKDRQTTHGLAINELLEITKETHIVLVEDDSYVFKKGKIDECFKKVESGEFDCVAGKRGSCSMEILEQAEKKWGIQREGYGDQGCNFWPNMFFIKKEDLLKTDRDFDSRRWEQGEYCKELDYTFKEEAAGDTMVHMSLQLRALGLSFWYENQYHGSPHDIQQYDNGQNLWDGKSFWTHVGSLSSGIGGVLVDDQGRKLVERSFSEPAPFIVPPARIDEWARRIQWWQTFYDTSDPNKIPEFREEYRKAINRLTVETKVGNKKILKRLRIYRELGL